MILCRSPTEHTIELRCTRVLQLNKQELISRITNLGAIIKYSVNQGIDFLVVQDQAFKLTNSVLLKEDVAFAESLYKPSLERSGSGSAEKSFSKIVHMFNDRSLRLLSSSSSFAHDPSIFENIALKSQKAKKKSLQSVNQSPENKDPNVSNLQEPESITSIQENKSTEFRNLYEFLNCKRWSIVSMSDFQHMLDVFESNTLEWHIKKGFKPLSSSHQTHFVVTSFTGKWKKDLKQNAHSFPYIPLTKSFDVLKINFDAPIGTSIFQTYQEKEMAGINCAKLLNKYESQLFQLKKAPTCRSRFDEQEPISNHINCTIWGIKYYRFFEHISSEHHK